MLSKLTLSVDDALVKRAKDMAARQGRSLSRVISEFLERFSADEKVMQRSATPITDQLRGSVKMDIPADFDVKEEYRKHLAHKHGC